MQVQKDISIKPYNTFGIDVFSKFFLEIFDNQSIYEYIQTKSIFNETRLVLGGGSNVLLTQNFDGVILKISTKGIEKVREDANHVYIKSQAGEVWHELVMYCIENGYAGIENLSLIPGCVGAAPMQNIGAYGVELKSVFESLEFLHFDSGKTETFTNKDCEFGYRESIFKKQLKDKGVITTVTLKLNKKPNYVTSYGAINQQLEQMGVSELSIKAISEAVCAIRRSKLPDPKQIGNSGSFFKNPVIPTANFEKLKKNYPDISGYKGEDGYTKVAAGWLIEQAGWKGKTINNYGVHKNQALVLVNYGGATGQEIYDLSQDIISDIEQKFGILLEREVNII